VNSKDVGYVDFKLTEMLKMGYFLTNLNVLSPAGNLEAKEYSRHAKNGFFLLLQTTINIFIKNCRIFTIAKDLASKSLTIRSNFMHLFKTKNSTSLNKK